MMKYFAYFLRAVTTKGLMSVVDIVIVQLSIFAKDLVPLCTLKKKQKFCLTVPIFSKERN